MISSKIGCHGVDLILTDRDAFDAGLTAITLAHTLYDLHPDAWEVDNLPRLWGRPEPFWRVD